MNNTSPLPTQSTSTPRSVVILGAGPAGSALACFLRQAGVGVRIYDPLRRPELLVGESFVPACVPLLRKLGVEEAVAKIAVDKPGATLRLYPDGLEWNLDFAGVLDSPAGYAYNVPRKEFDQILLDRAVELGATLLPKTARCQLVRDADSDRTRVRLDGEPEDSFIIDASGRSRHLVKTLGLDSQQGNRNDVALFAHLAPTPLAHPGNVHISLLKDGWCWKIPLPKQLSLGFVIPQESLGQYGNTATEQFDNLLQQHYADGFSGLPPLLQRSTGVQKYRNYQWIASQWSGENWALVGDAAGFVDPTFSSGVFLALYSADRLADSLTKNQSKPLLTALRDYETCLRQELARWQGLIESFYSGEFFSLVRVATAMGLVSRTPRQSTASIGTLMAGLGHLRPEAFDEFSMLLRYAAKMAGLLPSTDASFSVTHKQ